MQRQQLQKLSREELIREAERAGVPRPRVLTQAELIDEILKRTATSDRERSRARGWLGRARDLLATVVEKGLHLPDAAAAIRSGTKGWPPPPPPLPTVTLAEIYAAQGHLERAVSVLDEVLRREPDHDEARELRERFLAQLGRGTGGETAPPVAEATSKDEPEAAPAEPPPAEAAPAETPGADTEPEAAKPQEPPAQPVTPEPQAAAQAAPGAVPASVPPTMPAVGARDGEAIIDGAQAKPAAGEPEGAEAQDRAAGGPDAPVIAGAGAERPSGPSSVATTSRSPSVLPSSEPSGGHVAGVEIIVPVNVAPPVIEVLRDAPPIEAAAEEALADTAPAPRVPAARPPEGAASPAEGAAAAAEGAAEAAEVAAMVAEGAPDAASPAAPAPAAPAALPARYDVDEVVAIAVDPSTFYVYWEVRPTTFAHMAAQSPEGWLALRVTAVTPGWDGPIVETRDIRIDALYGDRFVHHVRPRADVRVSVGWLTEGRFDPIAVGTEISAPRAFVAAGAPAPAGAPLDLSEGPRGSQPGGAFDAAPAARALAGHTRAASRAAERLAAGWVPRDLSGVPIEGAPGGGESAPAGWIWVPGAGGRPGLPVVFGPRAGEPGEPGEHGSTVGDGTWWRASSEGGPWGGASEGGRWGGASEGGRWGGASEGGRWGAAIPGR